mgnify:CR=1 FL=1
MTVEVLAGKVEEVVSMVEMMVEVGSMVTEM